MSQKSKREGSPGIGTKGRDLHLEVLVEGAGVEDVEHGQLEVLAAVEPVVLELEELALLVELLELVGGEAPEEEAAEQAEEAHGEEERAAHALRHELARLPEAPAQSEAQHPLHFL